MNIFKHKWKPPNTALNEEAFTSQGGFQVWQAIGDMRERLARVEGTQVVLIGLALLILGLVVSERFF